MQVDLHGRARLNSRNRRDGVAGCGAHNGKATAQSLLRALAGNFSEKRLGALGCHVYAAGGALRGLAQEAVGSLSVGSID
jgi:hypothetical protein